MSFIFHLDNLYLPFECVICSNKLCYLIKLTKLYTHIFILFREAFMSIECMSCARCLWMNQELASKCMSCARCLWMNHVFGLKMYVMCTVSMDEPRVDLNMYLSLNRISMYFYSIFHVWQNCKRVFILISFLKLGQRNVQGCLFIKRCQCSEQLWETVSAMTPWRPSTVNCSLCCLRSKR